MLSFYASRFVSATNLIAHLGTIFDPTVGAFQSAGGDIESETLYNEVIKQMSDLREQLQAMGLTLSVKSTTRIIDRLRGGVRLPKLSTEMKELQSRIKDELDSVLFLRISGEHIAKYEDPLSNWGPITERFGCAFDIEEASKCLATDRFTACVFHLMRVVESGVMELQVFLKAPDIKAHFGSVVQKLEHLVQKTEYKDVPAHLQPYVGFMKDVLPQLHAVKDSWRNKVSHVDSLHLVPMGVFSEEMTAGIHSATKLLMTKLLDGLPPKEVSE